jgi:hypothetical protein
MVDLVKNPDIDNEDSDYNDDCINNNNEFIYDNKNTKF